MGRLGESACSSVDLAGLPRLTVSLFSGDGALPGWTFSSVSCPSLCGLSAANSPPKSSM